MPKFPDLQKLWEAYPNHEDPVDVGKVIGGAVRSGIGDRDAAGRLVGWIQNTCTIRLSRAFNYCGSAEFRIPTSFAFADKRAPAALNTVGGGDKLRYAFRVAEFLKFLREKFGKPPVLAKKERGDSAVPEVFRTRKGIIVFNDCGWSDATGHVDLWNGSECRHHGYWTEAKEVYLWTPDLRWAVTGAIGSQLTDGQTPVVSVTRR